jgi:uncharacterized protein YecT (DUF1311 family)
MNEVNVPVHSVKGDDQVRVRIVLLFALFPSVVAMGHTSPVKAQCYPGLACPTEQAQQSAPPQPTAPAAAVPSAAVPSAVKGGTDTAEHTSAAVAPAYACRDSKSAAELVICQNQDLAILDIRLNATYAGVQSRMTDAELKTLREQQRAWVKERDKCGANAACIHTLYQARLQQLSTR